MQSIVSISVTQQEGQMASTREKREKRDRASASRRATEHGTGDRTTIKIPNGMSLLKIKEGNMKLDFLEYKVSGSGNPWADDGQWHYERTFFIHRNVGPGGDALICPRKTKDKNGKKGRCFICEHVG